MYVVLNVVAMDLHDFDVCLTITLVQGGVNHKVLWSYAFSMQHTIAY